ncbi:BppU family phage baseplate upper protein [Sulfuricurvum sp.]|uniref:BppU family phage baseplate upper protein n=1 Tax=Sulfuricurvum sp. TaxID=2025608 RepID=UPI003563241A
MSNVVEEVHVGDIGTKFLVTVKEGDDPVDISEATTKNIIFKKPNGTSVTKAGIFETDGTDGKIYYKTLSASDLDVAGIWTIQASIVLPSLGTWKSSIGNFKVYDNL